MNSLIARVIVGGIVFLLLKFKLMQTASHKCKSPYTDNKSGFQGADCSNKALSSDTLPEDLGDISFLDISDNILTINENTFSKYTSLRCLIMRGISKSANNDSSTIHENAFVPLTKLEILDMTKTSIVSNIKWPTSLKNLTIAYCNLEKLDVNKLVSLEDFNASNNKLNEFPNFDQNAPLVSIDIRNNPIKIITTKNISFYCFLKYFDLSYINSAEEATDEYQYCSCVNLLNWMDIYAILPGSNTMNCTTFSKDLPICKEYVEPSCKERRLCFLRTQLDITMGSRVLIIAIFVISILLLIAIAHAKPVFIPKVADTHPFEHHDNLAQTNIEAELEDDDD